MNDTEGGGPAAPPPSPLSGFPEPTMTPPGWRAPADADLEARPHVLVGGYWVSFDRMHWWNGSMWVPGAPPRMAGPGGVGPVAVVVSIIGLILFAGFALSICQSMPHRLAPGP